MVHHVVLLGHLGDVCLLCRLSLANPGDIALFTIEQFVPLARRYGAFHSVHSFAELAGLPEDTAVTDLHGQSCQIPAYRDAVSQVPSLRFAATARRLKWLAVSGNPMRARAYSVEPIVEYWTEVLGLARAIIPLTSGTREMLHLTQTRPCRPVLSLQSSTRHKALGANAVKRLVSQVSILASIKPLIVEGPGRPTDGVRDLGVPIIEIASPEEFIAIAERRCCLVAVDNGLRHLASLIGIPRIVLYGPTSPGICGSGVGEVAVMSRAACAPCGDPHECQSDVRYCCLEDEVDYNELESAWAQLHGGR
ncbi:hypothetical protein HLY00_2049 [Mycolicibacterium hippocampi]|uniref:Glycosyl transferase n=2 Tax=Mycobacteriaceae TaxID=1762 RepID=A0A850PP41_9MYCO|nr:hypothetical protein [Mycolicibacterium hippocampi]